MQSLFLEQNTQQSSVSPDIQQLLSSLSLLFLTHKLLKTIKMILLVYSVQFLKHLVPCSSDGIFNHSRHLTLGTTSLPHFRTLPDKIWSCWLKSEFPVGCVWLALGGSLEALHPWAWILKSTNAEPMDKEGHCILMGLGVCSASQTLLNDTCMIYWVTIQISEHLWTPISKKNKDVTHTILPIVEETKLQALQWSMEYHSFHSDLV